MLLSAVFHRVSSHEGCCEHRGALPLQGTEAPASPSLHKGGGNSLAWETEGGGGREEGPHPSCWLSLVGLVRLSPLLHRGLPLLAWDGSVEVGKGLLGICIAEHEGGATHGGATPHAGCGACTVPPWHVVLAVLACAAFPSRLLLLLLPLLLLLLPLPL